MTMITVHESTGEITMVYDLPDGGVADTPVGGGYIVGEFDTDDYYVVAGVATVRPVLTVEKAFSIMADGVETVTIAMPNATEVYDHDARTTTTSVAENFVFKSTISGDFRFTLTPPFPHLIADFEVRAHAVF